MKSIIPYAIRLSSGQDLRQEIQRFAVTQQVGAGWVGSCVGSLKQYHIRFANQSAGCSGQGFFEMLSLSGTLSKQGCHLHICISDHSGKVVGGHLLEGCLIYTTAEIILLETDRYEFDRVKDTDTGWNELFIKDKKT